VQSYPFQQPERVFFNPFNSQEVWVTSFGNGMKTGTMSVGMGMLDFASKTDELIIYPNPSSEKINILFNSKMENSSFTILDITGRIVLSGNLPGQNSEISILGLSIGTYILQVKNVGGMYSTKFFVSK